MTRDDAPAVAMATTTPAIATTTATARTDTSGAVRPLPTAETKPPFVRHAEALRVLGPYFDAGEVGLTEVAVLDAAASRYPPLRDPAGTLALALALRGPQSGHLGVMLHRAFARLSLEGRPASTAEDDQPSAHGAALAAALPATAAAWVAAVRQHPWVQDGSTLVEAASLPAPGGGGSASGGLGTATEGDLVAPAAPARSFTTPFVWQPVVDPAAPAGVSAGILMTRRMWQEQARLAAAAVHLATTPPAFALDSGALSAALARLYPGGAAADEARAAGEVVATGRLSVITGGPGTGKTWGLKRVLALLLQAAEAAGVTLSVALAAPTGKAAVRMAEALAEDLHDLEGCGVPPSVLQQLRGLEPQTLHKLLGVTPHAPQRFRHGHHQRLGADVVVVDEASMVDVVMMRHLMEAIAPGSRLVLLGDRDQLASVEAGTVLADLVSGVFDSARRAANPELAGRIARLTRSHRFEKAASIACVAEGMQLRGPQDRADAVALMCRRLPDRPEWRARIGRDPRETPEGVERVTWLTADHAPSTSAKRAPRLARAEWAALARRLAAPYLDPAVDDLRHGAAPGGGALGPEPGFVRILTDARDDRPRRRSAAFHRQLLDALGRYRVLCAHRRGDRGVAGLNRSLSGAVRGALTAGLGKLPARGAHWLGRPLLVTVNSYDVDLRNGDVGLVVEGDEGRLTAAFPVGRDAVRYVALARLPSHETALAMTVHKSQGSQFDRVALVLPEELGSPLLTRELVYTGLTRAKWRVDWVGSEAVLAEAVARDVQRASGLAELLWR